MVLPLGAPRSPLEYALVWIALGLALWALLALLAWAVYEVVEAIE